MSNTATRSVDREVVGGGEEAEQRGSRWVRPCQDGQVGVSVVHGNHSPCALDGVTTGRRHERKPMWLMPVSIIWGRRAAGR